DLNRAAKLGLDNVVEVPGELALENQTRAAEEERVVWVIRRIVAAKVTLNETAQSKRMRTVGGGDFYPAIAGGDFWRGFGRGGGRFVLELLIALKNAKFLVKQPDLFPEGLDIVGRRLR